MSGDLFNHLSIVMLLDKRILSIFKSYRSRMSKFRPLLFQNVCVAKNTF